MSETLTGSWRRREWWWWLPIVLAFWLLWPDAREQARFNEWVTGGQCVDSTRAATRREAP